jgi:hypothetical protein
VARHQPVAFQRAQRLAQHLLRNAADPLFELAEAPLAVAEQQQDQHAPFVADPVEQLSGRAVACIGIAAGEGGFHAVTKGVEGAVLHRRSPLPTLVTVGNHGGAT